MHVWNQVKFISVSFYYSGLKPSASQFPVCVSVVFLSASEYLRFPVSVLLANNNRRHHVACIVGYILLRPFCYIEQFGSCHRHEEASLRSPSSSIFYLVQLKHLNIPNPSSQSLLSPKLCICRRLLASSLLHHDSCSKQQWAGVVRPLHP